MRPIAPAVEVRSGVPIDSNWIIMPVTEREYPDGIDLTISCLQASTWGTRNSGSWSVSRRGIDWLPGIKTEGGVV